MGKRVTTYHTENGVSYKGSATLVPLYDGSGAGFTFYPEEGEGIRCKIPNGSNIVYNRETGEEIGEYNPMWKHVVIVLEGKQ